MRPPIILCLAILLPVVSFAQQINYDSVVAPLDTMAYDFKEYLVQMAWTNHPTNESQKREEEIAALEARNTRKEWLDDVGVTFNINEGNYNTSPGSDGNIFFPRWNVGLTVNPFTILSQPTKNKIARQNIAVANLAVKEKKLDVRKETLIAYEAFKAATESLEFKVIFEQDAKNNYIIVKELYDKDEVTFQDYSTASTGYIKAQELRQNAEVEMRVAQYELESLIGMRWENVRHPLKLPQ